MIKNRISIKELIDYLNTAHEKDPAALHALTTHRVPCNEALALDDKIQVRKNDETGYTLSLLGILNGMFGSNADKVGTIAGNFNIHCKEGHSIPDELAYKDKCPECGNIFDVLTLIGFVDLGRR